MGLFRNFASGFFQSITENPFQTRIGWRTRVLRAAPPRRITGNPFRTRIEWDTFEGERLCKVEIIGTIPGAGNWIVWRIVLTDAATGKPIRTPIEKFQNPTSQAYLMQTDEREIPNVAYVPNWAPIAHILPAKYLIAPYKGKRQIHVEIILLRRNQLKKWQTSATSTHEIELEFPWTGYEEEMVIHRQVRALTVKLAIAVALADGRLYQSEKHIVRQWLQSHADSCDEEEDRRKLIQEYNAAIRTAYEQAKAKQLSLSSITKAMNEIAEPAWKYEAIELLHKVAAADGVAQSEEIVLLREVAERMDLDYTELEKIRDREFMHLQTVQFEESSILEQLGIEKSESPEAIKRKLRQEFRKWNGRLNSLPEGEEREHAQRFIDRIAEARKQYE